MSISTHVFIIHFDIIFECEKYLSICEVYFWSNYTQYNYYIVYQYEKPEFKKSKSGMYKMSSQHLTVTLKIYQPLSQKNGGSHLTGMVFRTLNFL